MMELMNKAAPLDLMDEAAVAVEIYGADTPRNRRRLSRMRIAGDGPAYVVLPGRVIRYPRGRVLEFIESRLRHSTAENPSAVRRPREATADVGELTA